MTYNFIVRFVKEGVSKLSNIGFNDNIMQEVDSEGES